jgi:hypothetical protein
MVSLPGGMIDQAICLLSGTAVNSLVLFTIKQSPACFQVD